jgi:hypothetical protein
MSNLLDSLAEKLAIKLSGVEPKKEEKPKLQEEVLKNGTKVSIEDGNVFVIPEEGERLPAPVGEHELEDGRILVVEEEGVLKEIKDAEGGGEEPEAEGEKKETELGEMKKRLEKVESQISELANYMKDKKEMEKQDEEKSEKPQMEKEQPKEQPEAEEVEASAEVVEPKKHSPEAEVKTEAVKMQVDQSKTILQNVMKQLSN